MHKHARGFLSGGAGWITTALTLWACCTAGCSAAIGTPGLPANTAPAITYTLKPRPDPYIREAPLEYHLYLPQAYTHDRDWPLFVGLHGAGGSAYDCLAAWQPYADQEGFVLLCPSLEDKPYGGWEHDEKRLTLNQAIASVQEECRLQAQVFLAGFSRGGHLAQRFAWAYPEATGAVAILSAVDYDPPDLRAKAVPFLVVLGDRDHKGGVEQVEDFAGTLRQAGFSVELHLLPDVGHVMTDQARELTLAFFRKTVGKRAGP